MPGIEISKVIPKIKSLNKRSLKNLSFDVLSKLKYEKLITSFRIFLLF